MKSLIINDNSGKKYEVMDIKRFYKHLVNYHTFNNQADNSVHEENGYYFTVSQELFDKVKIFIEK